MASERKTLIVVGSRRSELAMIQTKKVISALKEVDPEMEYQIETMETIGDKIQDKALSKIGQTNLFTKELEQALADKHVDMIVHSFKDLPTTLPDGMVIASVIKRDDPHDAVVFHPKHAGKTLRTLPTGSVLGTSSVRRRAQLKRCYPNLAFKDVRGNLNTRLRKLDEADDYSALILAKAGLERMGWNSRINQVLGPNECMYSVSQGAIAIEVRSDDNKMIEFLSKLHHMDSLLECIAERALLRKLEGGCSAPVGVYTDIKEGQMHLTAAALSLDGSECVKMSMSTSIDLDCPEKQESGSKQLFSGIVAHNKPVEPLKVAEESGSQQLFSGIMAHSKPVGPVKAVEEFGSQQLFSGIVAHGKPVGPLKAAEDLGRDLAIKILENGGREILHAAHEEIQHHHHQVKIW
ncbi:porphobilinogen deaminase-like [Anneissia japonica]|uniref:porphobilinogen deaminase-like n=1 Tax=Anneissia japonica TaxID=1529436 RepID=UPI0014256542|nr:porphobilinogen deaminase-like [Anneissia japonica]